MDLRPLRHPDIRRLWLGLFISRIGSAATFIAVPFRPSWVAPYRTPVASGP